MPMFYMMVGLPGSGKSFTAESIPNAVVHSSDAIRAEVLGDENDQTQQDLVFQTLHKRVLQDLVDGKDVVYDATNINYKRRIGFLDRVRALHKHDLRTVCLFMATPYEVCLERNNNRERSVPESVIQKMYFKFDVPMMAEGWDEIRIVGDEDRHDQIDTLMLRLSKLEHDNPHHEYTVGQHSMTAWQYLISHYKGADAALLRATLLHDIGKEKTKVFHDIKGNPTEIAHFYHHERVGAYDSFCYTGDLSPNQRLKAGTQSTAFCTNRLKTEPFHKWLAEHYPANPPEVRDDISLVYGFDANEQHRIRRRVGIMAAMGYQTEYPLTWEVRTIHDIEEVGIERPKTYSIFNHANCTGCLKAGKQHWFVVYCLYPEIWEKAKLAEDTIGYSILKQGYLSDFETEFAKLKEKALPPTEKAKPQTFWAAARKLIKDDDDLPCECSF